MAHLEFGWVWNARTHKVCSENVATGVEQCPAACHYNGFLCGFTTIRIMVGVLGNPWGSLCHSSGELLVSSTSASDNLAGGAGGTNARRSITWYVFLQKSREFTTCLVGPGVLSIKRLWWMKVMIRLCLYLLRSCFQD
jgi:hypothetical protein